MMTKRDVLSIALRVLGVWCFISVILSIPYLVFYLHPSTDMLEMSRDYASITLIGSVITHTILFVLGCVLIGAADGIAHRFVRNDVVIAIPSGVNMHDIFQLVLRVVGLVVFADNIPAVIRPLYSLLFMSTSKVNDLFVVLSPVVGIGIGIYLLTGARYLMTFAPGRDVITEESRS
ncbi:MAG: hypothetical protein ABFD54_08135 [Armatimonadota bacterium]|nr:hypothetical protein [bacterium]